ncbi:hypothetical protein [Nioella aestuarii]|uniref:hypothetical protein n=1 Tax=Nioella aestuarii TaxID=1662864 RepID=UPI003D7FB3A4
MTRTIFTTAALVLATAIPAQAEQFAVRIDAAYQGANDRLMEAMQITEIDSFSQGDAHYVVLDAPDEAYVEAFFFAIGRDAIELNTLDADWRAPGMDGLSVAQRLDFLRAIHCEFCTS